VSNPDHDLIQSLWIGTELSVMEQLSISSFLHHGHPYHLYVYENVRNVPQGAELMDAERIVPRAKAFQYTGTPSWAGFANSFRYRLLLEKGGWWADTDLICLEPFDFKSDYVFSSQFSLGRQMTNIGAIKCPANSVLMQHNWDVCQSKDPAKLYWGETGPELMEQSVIRHGLENFVQPYWAFCPIGFREWRSVLSADPPELPSDAVAVHLWHEMWRSAAQDKNTHYHPASLYERWRRQYLGPNDIVSVERLSSILKSM
jgi:hypothetical protein